MPKPIAGTAFLKVNGNQFQLRGDLNISIAGVEREGIAGLDGIHGPKEMPRVPFIEATLSDSSGLSLEDIMAIQDTTVTAELINGKVYILRNAWVATAIELDGGEGSFKVKFEGLSGEEITDNA